MDARTRHTITVTVPSDREFVLTRVYDAPRGLVFAAWTRPEHVRRWYCCSALTFAVCEIDLRVGGSFRYVMRAPDGVDHTITGVYREIAPPSRLVYTERYITEGFASDDALVTLTFAEHNGRTTLTSAVLHQSAEKRDAHLKRVESGAGQVFDRLEDYLRAMA